MRNVSRIVGVAIAVVLVAGVGALALRSGDDEPSTLIEVGGSGDDDGTDSDRDATTTVAPTTTLMTTTTAPVAATSAPAAAVTAASTTAPRPTTTAAPRAPSFEMPPTSGPAGTLVKTFGGACQGESYGVGIYIHDPSGERVDGDGSSTQPDGTWTLEFHMGHYQAGPGKYTIRPVCMNGASATVFEYAPKTFTVT